MCIGELIPDSKPKAELANTSRHDAEETVSSTYLSRTSFLVKSQLIYIF